MVTRTSGCCWRCPCRSAVSTHLPMTCSSPTLAESAADRTQSTEAPTPPVLPPTSTSRTRMAPQLPLTSEFAEFRSDTTDDADSASHFNVLAIAQPPAAPARRTTHRGRRRTRRTEQHDPTSRSQLYRDHMASLAAQAPSPQRRNQTGTSRTYGRCAPAFVRATHPTYPTPPTRTTPIGPSARSHKQCRLHLFKK